MQGLFKSRVRSITLEEEEELYDITVDKNHNLFYNGILLHNCDYTGLIGVIVDNFSDNPLIIDAGFRIAQGVVCPVVKANIVEVTEIMKDSERGANGFGSTGVK